MGEICTLISDLVEGANPRAFAEFASRFHRTIASAVIKTSHRYAVLSSELTDDLIQETYLRLIANDWRILRSFRADEEVRIYGLIQAVAFSTVHDHFRKDRAKKRGGATRSTALSDGNDAPRADPEQQYETDLVLGQIDALIGKISPPPTVERDRLIFWRHYRDGYTAKAIAEMQPGLTAKGVESVIHRITAEIRTRFAASSLRAPNVERNAAASGVLGKERGLGTEGPSPR